MFEIIKKIEIKTLFPFVFKKETKLKRQAVNGLRSDYQKSLSDVSGRVVLLTLFNEANFLLSEFLQDQKWSQIDAGLVSLNDLLLNQLQIESVKTEGLFLRFALWQMKCFLRSIGKELIVISPSNRDELQEILKKCCDILQVRIIEINENPKIIQENSPRKYIVNMEDFCDANNIFLSEGNSESDVKLRNICFLSGVAQSRSTYIIIRSNTFSNLENWNYFVEECVKNSTENNCKLIIFENSNFNTTNEHLFDLIVRNTNVTLIGGKLTDQKVIEEILETRRAFFVSASFYSNDRKLPKLNAMGIYLSDFLRKLDRKSSSESLAEIQGGFEHLKDWITNYSSKSSDEFALDYSELLLSGELKGKIALTTSKSNKIVLDGYQKYITDAFQATGRLDAGSGRYSQVKKLSTASVLFQWGAKETKRNRNLLKNAKIVGGPLYYIEDGFVRSVEIGVGGNPGLSFMIDDLAPYYDASRWSRVETMLCSDWEISKDQLLFCKECIDILLKKRISKYNHAPEFVPPWATDPRRKILLVDQRYGDESVPRGMATEATFRRMVVEAVTGTDEPLVILKRHPDGTLGGKGSYFSREILGSLLDHPNIIFQDTEINPHSLFEAVDQVCCVTSGMGFEALLARRPVHVYGAPFYAGWGLTFDELRLGWRSKKRSLEEIFYWSYIANVVYYNPDEKRKVNLKEFCNYIDKKKQANR